MLVAHRATMVNVGGSLPSLTLKLISRVHHVQPTTIPRGQHLQVSHPVYHPIWLLNTRPVPGTQLNQVILMLLPLSYLVHVCLVEVFLMKFPTSTGPSGNNGQTDHPHIMPWLCLWKRLGSNCISHHGCGLASVPWLHTQLQCLGNIVMWLRRYCLSAMQTITPWLQL